MNLPEPHNATVIVTGGSGFIGEALIRALAQHYKVICLDLKKPKQLPPGTHFLEIDLASDSAVQQTMNQLRQQHGQALASVVHLAGYFDLSGEPDSKYEEVSVRGTERLLRALQEFEVEQFIYSSTMLVHAPARPGQIINENQAFDPRDFPYRSSKIATEKLIHAHRGTMPVVYARLAGVYDDNCRNAFLANQIARIFERSPKGHLYPGDLRTGQSFLHVEDMAEAILRLIHRRSSLPPELPLLIGEPSVIGYGDLQSKMGQLIHGDDWETWQVPKALARTGVWIEDEVLNEDSFIRPWMVDIAEDHYAITIERVAGLLDWEPQHSLAESLPVIISHLKADPVAWYTANKLNAARVAMERTPKQQAPDKKALQRHMEEMQQMHISYLWVYFTSIGLGLWLIGSPFAFGLFDPETAQQFARDVTGERNLNAPELRNFYVGINDIVSGLLIVIFGIFSLSRRHGWAPWANAAVGTWLLMAPLIFWAPSAAAYNNDTFVGTLIIALAIIVPMMPGMSHEGMMQREDTPPGWTYCPSTYLQRLPIVALGLLGFLLARQLAAYQLGHTSAVWDPFFSGDGMLNGSEQIITSDISKAWSVADGGLGAVTYIFEILMAVMGGRSRWRTMPWMVALFGLVVGPLGVVSIYFIIIQPIVIGTYCTLCIASALAMLIMIPFALDELVAMGQFLRYSRRGLPFWRTFFRGGAMPNSTLTDRPGFGAGVQAIRAHMAWGVTVPWTLLVSSLLGVWLMFSRLIFETSGAMADSDHMVGALIITVAVIAMAEVARPLRFLNVLFGIWLTAAPWLLEGASTAALWSSVAAGLALILLSLPRGTRSTEHYGAWDRLVF